MKKFYPVTLLLALVGGMAGASLWPPVTQLVEGAAIKMWATGETLRASDLNANFTHIHSLMVGGHGARLVDADVSIGASISHAKLATPALLPKAWAAVTSNCSTATCTMAASSGITSITRSGTGVYTITFPPRANTSYGISLTTIGGGGTAALATLCTVEPIISTTTVSVDCWKNDGTGAADSGMLVMLMDNDN